MGRKTIKTRPMATRPSKSGRPWSSPQRTTLAEGIVDQMLQAFFSGRLQPGDFVGTEATLSEEFGVSRMAVRDAVRALDAYGLVETRKGAGGGILVRQSDPDRFIDALAVQLRLLGIAPAQAFDAQYAIETLTSELAAENATAAELVRLETILDRAEATLGENNRWLPLIFSFHIALAEASHSPALVLLMRAFIKILTPHYEQRTNRRRAESAVLNYRKLLAALRKRDGKAARAVMRAQLDQVRLGLPKRTSD